MRRFELFHRPKAPLRNHRVVDDLAVLNEHDHLSWCGPRANDFTRLAAAVFGAARNERLMLVGTKADLDDLRTDDRFDRLVQSGALTVQTLDEVYGDATAFDPGQQLQAFTAAVHEALGQGYRGLRVVADNTPMINGDDDTFGRWLAWEQLADQFIEGRPVIGVCYFDDAGVDAERLDVLSALHPITYGGGAPPPFRLFVDDGVMVVTGEIDEATITTLRRALAVRPRTPGGLVVDLAHADFVDHRTLQAFAGLGTPSAPVRLRGVRPTLRTLWQSLDLTTDTLQLC